MSCRQGNAPQEIVARRRLSNAQFQKHCVRDSLSILPNIIKTWLHYILLLYKNRNCIRQCPWNHFAANQGTAHSLRNIAVWYLKQCKVNGTDKKIGHLRGVLASVMTWYSKEGSWVLGEFFSLDKHFYSHPRCKSLVQKCHWHIQ